MRERKETYHQSAYIAVALLLVIGLVAATLAPTRVSEALPMRFGSDVPSDASRQLEIPRNIVVISVDTLRADHLGAYGYDRNTSPNIDRFARESVVFERAISPAHWTFPAHASLFTGAYPPNHIPPDLFPNTSMHLMADVFSEAGYRTAGFTGGLFLSKEYGFDRGFDHYRVHHYRKQRKLDFNATFSNATQWMRRHRGERQFVFIHGYDVHSPYDPPQDIHRFADDYSGPADRFLLHGDGTFDSVRLLEQRSVGRNGSKMILLDNGTEIPLTAEDVRHVRAHYDAGIRYVDGLFERFISRLKDAGLYEDTAIILLSDHGENLGDHAAEFTYPHVTNGSLFGHNQIYDHTVRVPIILRIPGDVSDRIPHSVSLVDVFPTLLDVADIPANESLRRQFRGRSLLPLVADEPVSWTNYTFAFQGYTSAVHTPSWKLMRWPDRDELYRVTTIQQGPQRIRSEQYPAVYERLSSVLTEVLSAVEHDRPVSRPGRNISEGLERRLESLGYLR